MDGMMTSNPSWNNNDDNTTTAFTLHQQHQHQQEAMMGTMDVPQVMMEANHVTGEEYKKPRPPQHDEPLLCPRCYSSNTKFCYYNNRSILQPRYYCKACRRFWTHGGSLRDVPVGGRCRKNKQRASPLPSSSSSESSSSVVDKQQHHLVSSCAAEERQDNVLLPAYGTAAEPLNFPNALPMSFMSGSFEMPPPFTPTMSWTPAPLVPSDIGTPSFLDMLGGVLNHEGNDFYGPTSSGMDMTPFGSSTRQDATPIGGGDATGHEKEQVAGADVQSKE